MADEQKKGFKAVLIGSTGATGKYLLTELIRAKEFSKIMSLGRRKAALPCDVTDVNLEEEEKSGRVNQVIIDFEDISEQSLGEYFKDADVYFSTFGTTRRQAGSANAFKHIDYGYNYNMAKVAKESNVRLMSLMSSQGANKDSFFLYLNSKGKLEADCGELGFPDYSVFRPGLLDRGGDARLAEKMFSFFMSKISVKTVARAMCSDAILRLSASASEKPESSLYYNDHITHMSDTYDLN